LAGSSRFLAKDRQVSAKKGGACLTVSAERLQLDAEMKNHLWNGFSEHAEQASLAAAALAEFK
jgi:hypothetical protein